MTRRAGETFPSDLQFAAGLREQRESLRRSRMRAAIERHETAQPACAAIRMYVSPWVKAPDGCLTRFIRQLAEVE